MMNQSLQQSDDNRSHREVELEARIEKLERLLAAMSIVKNVESPTSSLRGTSLLHSPSVNPNASTLVTSNKSSGSSRSNDDYSHARTLLSTMEDYHQKQKQQEQGREQSAGDDHKATSSVSDKNKKANYYDALLDPSEDDSSVELSNTKQYKRSKNSYCSNNRHHTNGGRATKNSNGPGSTNDGHNKVNKGRNIDVFKGGRPPMYVPSFLASTESTDSSFGYTASASSADDGAGIAMPPSETGSSSLCKVSSNFSTPTQPFLNVTFGVTRRPRSPSDVSVASVSSGIGRVMASPALKPVSTVLDYVKDGMTNRHKEGKAEYDSDIAIQEFLRVPFRVEVLLMFGLLVCVDCFLYVLTFLPLKFLWSTFCLLRTIVNPRRTEGIWFNRRHFYHVVQIAVIVLVSYMLSKVSIGRLYHWIRVQAMIKLYVIVAMVDVSDRLLISFGKDATDSLYWNINRRPYHPRCIASILVVLCYAAIHALLLFVHAATVNVALNSADAALLSLLVSGNFAEIKSTVFKKYQKKNLFDITTSDINERFKLFLFLFLIFVLNMCQGRNEGMTSDFAYVGVIVFCSEIIADWIKHCFITKINFIKSDVYIEYRNKICMDITGKGAPEGINMDHTHNVVRTVGLAQIPLVCVLVRYLSEAAKYSTSLLEISSTDQVLLVFVIFTILFIAKIFLGIVILNLASWSLSDVPSDSKTVDESVYEQVGLMKPLTKPLRSISMQQLFHGGPSDSKIHID